CRASSREPSARSLRTSRARGWTPAARARRRRGLSRRRQASGQHAASAYNRDRRDMTVVGLLLLVMGAGLVVAEAHLPSHGALGVAGISALLAGAIFAIAGAGAGLAVAIPIAAVLAAAATAGLAFVAS